MSAPAPPADPVSELRKRFSFDDVTIRVPRSVPPPFRPHAGRRIPAQTAERRSIVWLTPAEASLFGVPSNENLLLPQDSLAGPGDRRSIAVANIFHEGRFWVGLINPADVWHVLMQQEVFLVFEATRRPLAAHGQLRFLMKPGTGFRLHPQDEGQGPYAGPPLDDFIASAEAVGPRLEGFPSYDLVGGTRGWYIQSLRFLSTRDKAPGMLTRHHEVNQYLLRLDELEARNVLVESLRRSHQMGLDVPYHTLAIGGTQCVFEAFNILDRAVLDHRKNGGLGIWLSRMLDRMPIFVDKYLEARGLRYRDATYPPLDVEVAMSDEERSALRARLAQARDHLTGVRNREAPSPAVS